MLHYATGIQEVTLTDDTLDPRRHLDIEGAHNIRDLGGYPTAEGGQTRWGMFLRADGLSRLPVRSQAALIDYGLRTVIDLRRSSEIQDAPDPFFGSQEVAYYHQNLIGDAPIDQAEESTDPADVTGRNSEIYIKWLDNGPSRVYETLATLAQPDALPALYHCAGGKDRVGVVSALLLGLAGVPEETITADYALTGRFLVQRHFDTHPELVDSGYTWQQYQREFCPPDVMVRVLDHLNERYGGIEAYTRTTGLNSQQISALRAALVE